MKSEQIQGKIISHSIVAQNQKIEFSIDEVHKWTDEGEEL